MNHKAMASLALHACLTQINSGNTGGHAFNSSGQRTLCLA
jgi:hypothetical protein